MSRTIDVKSAVASGWKTIAALPELVQLERHLQRDRGGRHREQPALGRRLDLALAGEDVEEAHAEAVPCSCRSRRSSAAIRFSIGGCVANRPPMRLAGAGREDVERRSARCCARRSRCGIRSMPLEIRVQRRGERARAAGDQRGAAVGRELAVARERLHEEERDRRRRRSRRGRAPSRSGCRRRRRGRRRTGSRTARCRRRSWRRTPASVITSTSRLATCVSSCAITPSSSAGESSSMIPVVAQTVAVLGRAAERERVRHARVGDRDLRLGQVGLHAQALDHRVQLGRLRRA